MRCFITVTILALIFSSAITNAQPYQSIFGQNSTKWVFKYSWQGLSDFLDSAYVQKDTIVSGILYKKVVCNPSIQPWLIREELNSGSVWARYIKPYTALGWEDTVEKLILRMDLNVGDTFDIYNLGLSYASPDPDSLKIVDSINVINGLKHVYFRGVAEKYQLQNEPFTLIEGIGSNMGILWKYQGGFMERHYLLCSYKDGQRTDFQNLFYSGDCKPYLSVQMISDTSTVTIYPNPADQYIYVQSQVNRPVTRVEIRTVDGKIFKGISTFDGNKVDVQDLSAGYYFAYIFIDERLVVRPVIIYK